MNGQSANMALKRIEFEGRLVSHGLKAFANSTLNEQSFDPDVIEAALAHIDRNEVRRAYAKLSVWNRDVSWCDGGASIYRGSQGRFLDCWQKGVKVSGLNAAIICLQ